MNDYQDIINYNYQGPKNHIRMSIENRASQFASFKALTGYEEELKETRRIVDSKIELDDDKKNIINQKLNEIKTKINNQVEITYFVKDLKKDGGYYKKVISNIKKIDLINQEIILINKDKIQIDNIYDINLIK